MNEKLHTDPKKNTSTFCIFEIISEVTPLKKPKKPCSNEDILNIKSISLVPNPSSVKLESENTSLNLLPFIKTNVSQNSGNRNETLDSHFRQLHLKRLQEKAMESLKADGMLVYCVSVEQQRTIPTPGSTSQVKNSRDSVGIEDVLSNCSNHQKERFPPDNFDTLCTLPDSNSTNPFRLAFKKRNKNKNLMAEKYVGNIFVPDGSCETQMVKSNLPSNCSEDSHLLEESCTSSRYSPSETPTVEATQNMKDYVTFRKNSREYLTFKKANLKEKFEKENFETLFARDRDKNKNKISEENASMKFSFPKDPLRPRSPTPPLSFIVPPVPASMLRNETPLPSSTKYLNDHMTADGKLVEDNTSNEALLDAKPRVILKGERQYEPYVPFPFEPKIVTPAPFWQPWCYFMPGMPPKYKRGQYSAKTNFPGKPSGAKTATSPYQQNPQGFYPPTAGYGNGPAGYANYPMYPPPQPQYGKPTGSPYGNAPAGVGMTPLPGGMPYPGYMVPPHLMPTMAPCSCPCPVKVPIRLRNKNDVKVVVRYTAHGPPPCCNCSCCC